jgi:hypothetical protein
MSDGRGGDRRSEKARAEQAARRPNSLASEIAEQRQRLDQTFYEHIRKLRQQHGDRAVDQALKPVASATRFRRCCTK